MKTKSRDLYGNYIVIICFHISEFNLTQFRTALSSIVQRLTLLKNT